MVSTDKLHISADGAVPLDAALQRIESLLGLRYQQHQWSDLLRLLKPAARDLDFADVAACVQWLAYGDVSAGQIRILGKHLTIGESYFFREIVVFSILKEHILPQLIEKKEKRGDTTMRIWSAGCSTGEEVYSLAILLDSFLREKPEWRYFVHGTDINPTALSRAETGVYREWSFRDLPDGIMDQYFRHIEDGRYEVVPHIRARTEFSYRNLAEAPAQYPAGYDIIFCRNVLMYFSKDKIRDIVQGFRRAVREGGWLIPSLTETTLIHDAGFEGNRFGDAILFVKQPRMPNIIPMKKGEGNVTRSQAPAERATESQWRSSFASILPFRAHEKRTATQAALKETPAAQEPHSMDREVPSSDPTSDSVTASVSESQLLVLARKLADQGALEEACATAEMAAEQAKMDPEAHFIYATILREMGETSKAIDEFNRALYLDHGYISAHFAMGSLYRHLGETARARRHLRNALELLHGCDDPDAIIDHGELTVRRMMDIIQTMLGEE
jgi:chemotaxis protein methyltransferase CheR